MNEEVHRTIEKLKKVECLHEDLVLIDDYINKLEAENIGLKQTVSNFREKQEKFFKNI